MSQSTLALIIFSVVVLLYLSGKIPLAITSVLAMLAMYVSGILTFSEALAGFSSSSVMLVIGMMIIGLAFENVGLAQKAGQFLVNRTSSSERIFVCLLLVVTAVAASFFSSIVVMTIMLQVADNASWLSGGKYSRKSMYMPLAFGAIYGSTLTSVSAASIVTASGMLADSQFGREFNLLEPAILGLPVVIITVLLYWLFGYRYAKKIFDFEEAPLSDVAKSRQFQNIEAPKWKQILTVAVIIGCVVCFSLNILTNGAVALIGACILILTGCIDEKTAFRNVNWSVVLIVVGSLGFAKGILKSGAGELIAMTTIQLCGPLGESPYAMCVVFMLLAALMTNFTSNTSSVTVMLPISLVVAQGLGAELLPYAIAVAVGANFSTATPIACANMSLTTTVGYRVKDYLRVGGVFTLVALAISALVLKLVFFI